MEHKKDFNYISTPAYIVLIVMYGLFAFMAGANSVPRVVANTGTANTPGVTSGIVQDFVNLVRGTEETPVVKNDTKVALPPTVGAAFAFDDVCYGENVAQQLATKNYNAVANGFNVVTEKDRACGNPDAKIVMIEYSDLECPFCKQFHQTMVQTMTEYKGKLAWVYRHFPLDSLHPKARKEAEAVECVQKFGGTKAAWLMIDKIFKITPANNGLDHAYLPEMAKELGVNENDFSACLASGEMAGIVDEQYKIGVSAGVQGTPAVFVVNIETGEFEELPGAVSFEAIKASVDKLLGTN